MSRGTCATGVMIPERRGSVLLLPVERRDHDDVLNGVVAPSGRATQRAAAKLRGLSQDAFEEHTSRGKVA